MADSNANYLPPGWTEEMYENPMEHEAAWDALADEQFQRLQLRRAGSSTVTDTAPGASAPLPAPCVEAIEEAGLQDWGFSIFRVDYGDASAWSNFVSKFNTMIDAQLTPASGGGIDAVRDALHVNFVENEDRLQGAGSDAIRTYARELQRQPGAPASLGFSAVFMVDAAVIQSVGAHQPKEYAPETPTREKRRGAPWVWAVDLDYDEAEEEVDEDYRGLLKVAASSLVNELFPIIATGRLGLEELIPSEGDEGVWFSVYSPY